MKDDFELEGALQARQDVSQLAGLVIVVCSMLWACSPPTMAELEANERGKIGSPVAGKQCWLQVKFAWNQVDHITVHRDGRRYRVKQSREEPFHDAGTVAACYGETTATVSVWPELAQ